MQMTVYTVSEGGGRKGGGKGKMPEEMQCLGLCGTVCKY